MASRNVGDPDFWWHLRTGQLILQNHAVFHTDPYSFTRHGQPWVSHEWLSEVLIYLLYRGASWLGLILAFGAVTGVTFLLLYRRCAGQPYLAAILTLWGAIASQSTWGVRPHTLSLLLASVFLVILEKSAIRKSVLWCTIPLMLLWVNLHAEYALGIGVMAIFWLGLVLDCVFGFSHWPETLPRLKRLGVAILACLSVVPLNPNGVRLFVYPLETIQSKSMQRYIDEWASPNFHLHEQIPLLLLILAVIGLVAFSPRKLRPRELLLLTVTLAAALQSGRHVGIFVLVAVPIMSELGIAIIDENGWGLRERPGPPGLTAALLNMAILIGFCSFAVLRVLYVAKQQSEVEAKAFPAAAVAYIDANHPPGPILNNPNWGGYLIWKLYPDYAVFIDGRADLYGDDFLDELASTYLVQSSRWERVLEEWNIRTVFLPPDAPLISVLAKRAGWKQLYADHSAVLMTRGP